jgi:hypothetical protein
VPFFWVCNLFLLIFKLLCCSSACESFPLSLSRSVSPIRVKLRAFFKHEFSPVSGYNEIDFALDTTGHHLKA